MANLRNFSRKRKETNLKGKRQTCFTCFLSVSSILCFRVSFSQKQSELNQKERQKWTFVYICKLCSLYQPITQSLPTDFPRLSSFLQITNQSSFRKDPQRQPHLFPSQDCQASCKSPINCPFEKTLKDNPISSHPETVKLLANHQSIVLSKRPSKTTPSLPIPRLSSFLQITYQSSFRKDPQRQPHLFPSQDCQASCKSPINRPFEKTLKDNPISSHPKTVKLLAITNQSSFRKDPQRQPHLFPSQHCQASCKSPINCPFEKTLKDNPISSHPKTVKLLAITNQSSFRKDPQRQPHLFPSQHCQASCTSPINCPFEKTLKDNPISSHPKTVKLLANRQSIVLSKRPSKTTPSLPIPRLSSFLQIANQCPFEMTLKDNPISSHPKTVKLLANHQSIVLSKRPSKTTPSLPIPRLSSFLQITNQSSFRKDPQRQPHLFPSQDCQASCKSPINCPFEKTLKDNPISSHPKTVKLLANHQSIFFLIFF